MQNHKCNKVENAFPILKVSCLVRVHIDFRYNCNDRVIFFAVSYV